MKTARSTLTWVFVLGLSTIATTLMFLFWTYDEGTSISPTITSLMVAEGLVGCVLIILVLAIIWKKPKQKKEKCE